MEKPVLSTEKRFHHVEDLSDSQTEAMGRLRAEFTLLGSIIEETCEPSRETSLALTKLEEAAFWANASIARHGA